MNVALVIEWLDPWRGGAETSTQQFIHALIERGVHLDVYTRSRLSPTPAMKVHTISTPVPARVAKTAVFVRRVDRRIHRQSYDIVHAITPCMTADVYQPRGGTVVETIERNIALRRPRAARNAKRVTGYLNIRQQLMQRLERRLLTRSDPPMVAAVSNYVARQLHDHYSYPPNRVRVVFNGVSVDDTPPEQRIRNRAEIRTMYGIGEGELLVILMAHNFRLKGVARWIDTVSRLSQHHELAVRSLVVGKENPARWQRLVARAQVGDRIQFVGPTERAAAFRHAADILVHPTYYDPCSRVVLEALSCGLPCITTSYDGASEVIESGKHGLVVSTPDDVDELARAVITLADPKTRERISQACKPLQKRLGMHRHVDEMLALYHDLGVPVTAV